MDIYVYVLISSLRYEPEPDQVKIIKRETLSRMMYEKKARKDNHDLLIQRITFDRYLKESNRIEREDFRKQYDKAIMQKYNVGSDYRNNRYFMEQVRPTLNY